MTNHPQTLDEYIEERAALKAAAQTSELRRELDVTKRWNRELSEAVDDLHTRLDDEAEKNSQLDTAVSLFQSLLEEAAVREDELRRTIRHLREEMDQAEHDRSKLEANLFLSYRREDDLRNLLTLERLRQFQISESITVEGSE